MKNALVVVSLLVLSSPLLVSQQASERSSSASLPGKETILADDLRKYIQVLTSDSLEGRETAYPGQHRAADYIASQFKRFGLKPAGSDGSFLQPYDVTVVRIDPATNITASYPNRSETYTWGKEFISESGRDTTLTAPIAFIGHTDCEISEADRAALSGRIVFVLAGKREFVSDTSRSQVMRRLFAQRREPGAAAIFIVADDEGPASFESVAAQVRSFGADKGRMSLGKTPVQRSNAPLRYFISAAKAREMIQFAGGSLNEWRTKARQSDQCSPLITNNVSLTIRSRILREVRQAHNVVGILEGSDPELRDQAVVISGHFDHLGKSWDGTIYRGADDDASGTSAVMEIAEAFGSLQSRPKRSLLFLAVSGEEKGLLGSTYYTDHPSVPLNRTVADLNIDMIGRVDTTHEALKEERYVYVIGADKISTQLDSIISLANRETAQYRLDLTFNDEKDPNQFYRRSDHYNFAKNGVPVAFFFTGIHADYHRPSDTPDKLLYDRMADIVRIIYASAWKLAHMPAMLTPNAKTN